MNILSLRNITRRNITLGVALASFAMFASASESRADSCSASAATILSRSTGGTCPQALALNQDFTFTYRIRNDSIIDSGPNDGTLVQATIFAGRQMEATLAQETAAVGSPQLSGTLTFVPVCPTGSVGGTKAAGDVCNPNLSECGSLPCGCASALAGVTCTANGANKVNINITQNLVFSGGQQRNIATIRVKTTDLVDPPATCGQFFSRIGSIGDIITTTDAQCTSAQSAGAQASANLHAPECLANADCGDTQCNMCANVGTNNTCTTTNIGGSCGSDANATDCKTPACVNVSGEGFCQQLQNNTSQGTTCTNNGGVVVGAVQCQSPICNATGTCANSSDPTQNGNACGTDSNTNDCLTPACLAGTCAQGQTPVTPGSSCTNNGGTPVPTVECQQKQCAMGGTCANVADPSKNGTACGTDANGTDCLTPACVTGTCTQGQTPVAGGTSCTNNGGTTVPVVPCQERICTTGTCGNVADADQNGSACPDTDSTNCHTPQCASGACNQDAVCAPSENPSLCQVTISDKIFDDANQNGIQDGGEAGIPDVDVDVYSCSGNVLQVLQGSDTTDANGLYSFSVATCNTSEKLAIDVSDEFTDTLNGYTESDAFCDAGNPPSCGGGETPAVDSNCVGGISDCRTINRGVTDQSVDCGYTLPEPCDVSVTKQACVVAPPGSGCTGSAIAVLLQWGGPGPLPVGTQVLLTSSTGATASTTLVAPVNVGTNLVIQNGFTIDAAASGKTNLGTSLTLKLNGVTQEIFQVGCTCPASYNAGGQTYYTNLIVKEPMCLDAASPDNADATKGYPSPKWTLVGLKDPTLGSVFADTQCSSVLPAPEGEACKIIDNKISAIQFEYVGAQGKANNCANKLFVDPKAQNTGSKLVCTGTANDSQPVRIVALSKDGSPTWFDSGSANINVGDEFTILSSGGGKTLFENDTYIRVFNGGGTKIEEVTFATLCKDHWVNVGDIYGGFKVIGVAGTLGGELPSDDCPEVEYRYTLTNQGSTGDFRVCDDQLGEVAAGVTLATGVPTVVTAAAELVASNGQCGPLENTARVLPNNVPCPDPADALDPDVCGIGTAQLQTTCVLAYPYSSPNPRTAVVFNENEVLRAFRNDGTAVQAFYGDEHALTLGIRRVSVTTGGGTAVTNYAVTASPNPPACVNAPAVGSQILMGDQRGTDLADRPMWPALFITDITSDPNLCQPGDVSGKCCDWQAGPLFDASCTHVGIPPTSLCGVWKAAARTVNKTVNPNAVTITPDADPAVNNLNLGVGSDPWPAGVATQGYNAEARWDLASLGLTSGHSYRFYFMVHDGDQNKTGGDVGHACTHIYVP